MGILSEIAKKLKGDCCERLVEYIGQQVTVTGVNAGVANFKIDIGGFSNKIKEINQVPETMKALDNNQYLLCRQISALNGREDESLKEDCIRIRLMNIMAFTQLQALLSVPKPNRELRAEIVAWIRQMNTLAQQGIDILKTRARMTSKGGFGRSESPIESPSLSSRIERATIAQIMAYQGIDEKEMNEALSIIKQKSRYSKSG